MSAEDFATNANTPSIPEVDEPAAPANYSVTDDVLPDEDTQAYRPLLDTDSSEWGRWGDEVGLQEAARSGDREALEELIGHYYPSLVRYARRMYAGVDNSSFYHRAEDSVQEAILKILGYVARSDSAEEPPLDLAYFYRAVRSNFLDWLKSAAYRTTRPIGQLSGNPNTDEQLSHDRSLTTQTYRAERETAQDDAARFLEIYQARIALAGVWRTLNERQQEYVYMRFVEGRSIKEIGQLKGLNPRAVQRVFTRVFAHARKLEDEKKVTRPDSTYGVRLEPTKVEDSDDTEG